MSLSLPSSGECVFVCWWPFAPYDNCKITNCNSSSTYINGNDNNNKIIPRKCSLFNFFALTFIATFHAIHENACFCYEMAKGHKLKEASTEPDVRLYIYCQLAYLMTEKNYLTIIWNYKLSTFLTAMQIYDCKVIINDPTRNVDERLHQANLFSHLIIFLSGESVFNFFHGAIWIKNAFLSAKAEQGCKLKTFIAVFIAFKLLFILSWITN